MVSKRDIEKRDDRAQDGRVPLISQDERRKENNFMVYLSTFVAVCGSFSFGTGVGYSSPTEASIKKDLNLTIAQYSLFGSLLTFGAMTGAVASGPMADFFGRKGTYQIALAAAPALAVTGIPLYITGFLLGMGAVPWVTMSEENIYQLQYDFTTLEIFPIDIKGRAGGLVTLVNWAGAWAVSYTFNFLLTWSSYVTFLLYANVACINVIIVCLVEFIYQDVEV